ncbi:MAG: hypothetical protein H6922_01195 [Pseudomonadaceae bacterium]|nr:hypothetical protein [Pseudomonadaceae bacterium]
MHTFGLFVVMTVVAPLAYAADIMQTCRDLEQRIDELDEKVVCANGEPNLSLMLERNFLTQLHEGNSCRTRELMKIVEANRKAGACRNVK